MARRKFLPPQRLSTSKRYKENVKRENEESIENLKEIGYYLSNKTEIGVLNNIDINENGVEDFFNKISLETNKIHIIRGNNGQGKSTLLKNIANSTSLDCLDVLHNRMKVASNTRIISDALNSELSFSPFKAEEGSLLDRCKIGLSNVENNITIYVDFSISFFREQSFDTLSDITEEVYSRSNGERKIKAINSVFSLIKIFLTKLDKEKIKNGFNILVVLDEPESGLSLEIQEEFYKKVLSYIKKAIAFEKISLTFIIASHSFIWKKEKYIEINNINNFKKEENKKKEHKKVFI